MVEGWTYKLVVQEAFYTKQYQHKTHKNIESQESMMHSFPIEQSHTN